MSATLIAVVIVLIAGHALQSLTALRRIDWLVDWRRYIDGLSADTESALNGRTGLLLIVGLPVLLIGLLQLALQHSLWGIPEFVFAVLLLFYCWGPRDLDLDVDAIVDAPDTERKRAAAASLLPANAPSFDGHALIEGVFAAALRRWFGPLFWFLLLGPAGVLLYRIGALLGSDPAHADMPSAQREAARWLLLVLEWPVAQLMTLALALAANFDAVFSAWREWHAGGARLDTGFLGAAARASVDIEIADDDTDVSDGNAMAATPALLELRDAMSLIWRMLLLWLAVLALFVIARLLG